jgi:hypothetical protein
VNIIKHLVAANRNEKGNTGSHVVMTTHSPYVLSVLNVLLAEARLYDFHSNGNYKAGIDDFVNYDCYMSAEYYSALYITEDGTFVNLIDQELPMISGLQLDGVSDWVEERIAKVNQFIYD